MYITEKNFLKSNYEVVCEYRNNWIKDVLIDGKIVCISIIPENSKVIIENIDRKKADWHGANGREVVFVRLIGENAYFPTELVAGTISGGFNQHTEKAKKYGWIPSVNTGIAGSLMLKSKIQKAAMVFKEHGFKVEFNNNNTNDKKPTDLEKAMAEYAGTYF